MLTPTDLPVGTKRTCVDTDYYDMSNCPNVTLVDVRHALIKAITPTGLRTSDAEYPLDSIVFATGYDAVTGTLSRIDVQGRGGRHLKEKWADGPRTYLGIMTAGFSNLFILTGPGSPSVLTNIIAAAEQHVDWTAACLAHMPEHDLTTIEAAPDAEERVAEVNAAADRTLFPLANVRYIGANILGKPLVFLPYVGGLGTYMRICNDVVQQGYKSFNLV